MGNTGSMQPLSMDEIQHSLPHWINQQQHQQYQQYQQQQQQYHLQHSHHQQQHSLQSSAAANAAQSISLAQQSKEIIRVLPEAAGKSKPLRSTNNGIILQSGGTISGRKINGPSLSRSKSITSINHERKSSNMLSSAPGDHDRDASGPLSMSHLGGSKTGMPSMMQSRSKTQIDILPNDKLKRMKHLTNGGMGLGPSSHGLAPAAPSGGNSSPAHTKNGKQYNKFNMSEPDLLAAAGMKKTASPLGPTTSMPMAAGRGSPASNVKQSAAAASANRQYSNKPNKYFNMLPNSNSNNINNYNNIANSNVNNKTDMHEISPKATKLRLFRTRLESTKIQQRKLQQSQHINGTKYNNLNSNNSNNNNSNSSNNNSSSNSNNITPNYSTLPKPILTHAMSNDNPSYHHPHHLNMERQMNVKQPSMPKFSLFRREKSFDITLLRNQKEREIILPERANDDGLKTGDKFARPGLGGMGELAGGGEGKDNFKRELELATKQRRTSTSAALVKLAAQQLAGSPTPNKAAMPGPPRGKSNSYLPTVQTRKYTAPSPQSKAPAAKPVPQTRKSIANNKAVSAPAPPTTASPATPTKASAPQPPAGVQKQANKQKSGQPQPLQPSSAMQTQQDAALSMKQATNKVLTTTHTIVQAVPAQVQPQAQSQPRTFFFGMGQTENDMTTCDNSAPLVNESNSSHANGNNIDEEQLEVIDLFAKSLLNLNRLQEAHHVSSESAPSSVVEDNNTGASTLESFINDDGQNVGGQSQQQQQILLKLRPTLPRKQFDIPRFSPSAAWKLLETIDINHVSADSGSPMHSIDASATTSASAQGLIKGHVKSHLADAKLNDSISDSSSLNKSKTLNRNNNSNSDNEIKINIKKNNVYDNEIAIRLRAGFGRDGYGEGTGDGDDEDYDDDEDNDDAIVAAAIAGDSDVNNNLIGKKSTPWTAMQHNAPEDAEDNHDSEGMHKDKLKDYFYPYISTNNKLNLDDVEDDRDVNDLDDVDDDEEEDDEDDDDASDNLRKDFQENTMSGYGHTFSLSLPRERHIARDKMQLNSFNSLQKSRKSVNGHSKGPGYFGNDSNWVLSYSVPNSINPLTNAMEQFSATSNSIIDSNNNSITPMQNQSLITNLTSGRHKMYLPAYTKDTNNNSLSINSGNNNSSNYNKSAPCDKQNLSDMPVPTLSNAINHEKHPHQLSGGVLNLLSQKSNRFAFQSTIRKIERRRLAERLSKEAEEKEAQRLSELEAMRKVEEEFKQKRAREKATLRHQLRLVSLESTNHCWSANVERDEPDGAVSSPMMGETTMGGLHEVSNYQLTADNMDDYVDTKTPYISRLVHQKSSKFNPLKN